MFDFLDKLALNKGLMLLACALTFALSCIEMSFALKRGKIYSRGLITAASKALLIAALAFGLGYLINKFPVDAAFGRVLYYVILVSVLAACIAGYLLGQRKQVRLATANALRKSAGSTAVVRNAKNWLYGTSFSLFIFAALMLAFGRADYYMPMFPVAVVAVATLLASMVAPRLWYGIAAVALAAFFVLSFWRYISAAQMDMLCFAVPALATTAMMAAACICLTIRK